MKKLILLIIAMMLLLTACEVTNESDYDVYLIPMPMNGIIMPMPILVEKEVADDR